jgi:hypothetical protein
MRRSFHMLRRDSSVPRVEQRFNPLTNMDPRLCDSAPKEREGLPLNPHSPGPMR